MLHAFLALVSSVQDQAVPVELGRVAWQRDHEAAFAAAKSSGKPVLLFFQEVPG